MVLISIFVGEDFENLDGNVAVIDITGTIMADKDTNFLFEDVTSSEEINKLRVLMRISKDLSFLDFRKYEYVSNSLKEMEELLDTRRAYSANLQKFV